MKKIIIYSLMLLTSVAYYSCSDKDENLSANISREFMPMFRCDNNTGKGSTDPYNCHTISPNSVYLCWYTVDNCVGYEIQWGILAGSQGDVLPVPERPKKIAVFSPFISVLAEQCIEAIPLRGR